MQFDNIIDIIAKSFDFEIPDTRGFEYDIDDDILYLGNPKEQIGITYDGYFRDIDDEDIVYVPENMNAKELFREFAYQ